MPYKNEHAARLRDPDDFDPDSFRRTKGGKLYNSIDVPKTIGIIWGKLKGKAEPEDPPLPQALRFPTKDWTAGEARKWLKDNKIKYISFEPAEEKKAEGAGTSRDAENPEIERRFLEFEVRAAGDGEPPAISGMAAVYNREAVIADFFREVIRPGAFRRVLSENPDVVGSPNHNWDIVLGRTIAGTLKLEDRENDGLHYSITINQNDQEAMNFYSRVQRGDIRHSSFAFTVRKELWTTPENPQELPLRAVLEVDKLYDVSPVTFPAYPTTTASVRSQVEEIQQEMEQASQAASGGAEDETPKVEARRKARSRILQLLDHK
jgi:HK97 family phage prohead protease